MQDSFDLGPLKYDYPKYMSPSSISTFQQCPLKFKFYKLDRLPTESTEAQHLGSFVHEVLEELFTYPRDWNPNCEAPDSTFCRVVIA